LQMVFVRRYWIQDKRELLENQAKNVAALMKENVVEYYPNSYYISEELRPTLMRLAMAAGVNVMITDTDHRIVMCSHADCTHYGKTIPAVVRNGLSKDNFFVVNDFGDLYTESQYVTGGAMRSAGGKTTGYVVVSSSATALGAYIMDNLRIYMLSAVVVLMLAFVALYLMTYRLVRPLRQMAAITRSFSNGDFSGRVKVRGHDEVAQLAHALNGMAVSLSSVEDMRRSFVANVSHDLKTPMTTIAGFIDGILDGTVPSEKRREYLKIVSEETKRLSRLVSTMLDLSRIDSGQLKIAPVSFDLTSMVCSTILSFERRVEDKHIVVKGLEECAPQTVYADYDLLQQVIYNLLDNAVKFTEEGGTISVGIRGAEDYTECTLRNTGSGIPAAELPQIFERFYKSDRSRGLDKQGTGLGLYIVKSVINLHGGDITVHSTEGQYTEFVLRLPCSQKK
ncbi:MAG: HAMP domain-containing histidine kinase, partial [Clostridia bacterium]|nr:HAMP domain-containing histidine kinase [Clostridia bacterium]